MFCEKCGSKLPDVCVFCTNCGARVEVAPLETANVEIVNIEPISLDKVPVETVPVETVPVVEEELVVEESVESEPLVEESVESEPLVEVWVEEVPEETVPVEISYVETPVIEPISNVYQDQPAQNLYQAQPTAYQAQPTGYQAQPTAYQAQQTGYQQPINNQYLQAPVKVKKPFPKWINVILFLFALLSIAALVAAFVLGKMATKEANDGEDVVATLAQGVKSNPKDSQTEILGFELGGTVYEIAIPETEASKAGAEFENGYIIANSDSEYLEYDYLIENYTADLLLYAYYEIYARYGVSFEDTDVAAYFTNKTWYEPIMTEDEFIEDDSIVMNDYEVANITTIEEAYDYLY